MSAPGMTETTRLELLEPVLRRHSMAMKVVKRVNDEDARWVLLDHVVTARHPRVEVALASPFVLQSVASGESSSLGIAGLLAEAA